MRTRTHVSLVLAGVLLGCGNPTSQPEDRTGIIVPDGKADDFLSLSATEFVVSGRATVTLEAEFADASEEQRTARLRELVPRLPAAGLLPDDPELIARLADAGRD